LYSPLHSKHGNVLVALLVAALHLCLRPPFAAAISQLIACLPYRQIAEFLASSLLQALVSALSFCGGADLLALQDLNAFAVAQQA
jgi:hypothetical protein